MNPPLPKLLWGPGVCHRNKSRLEHFLSWGAHPPFDRQKDVWSWISMSDNEKRRSSTYQAKVWTLCTFRGDVCPLHNVVGAWDPGKKWSWQQSASPSISSYFKWTFSCIQSSNSLESWLHFVHRKPAVLCDGKMRYSCSRYWYVGTKKCHSTLFTQLLSE